MARKAPGIARKARIACEKWREYFKYNIDQYHDMHQFILGEQWNQEEEDMMVTNKKIPLTANKLAPMANALLGEQQQNTPQLEVVPMTNCDQQTAHLRDLVVKDIVFSNNSKTVYQVAAGQAFIGSFGAFLIDTDYMHSHSFDLDIIFRHFKDSSRCYWDVGAEHINKIDGMVCGYISRITRQKFRAIYGSDVEKKILIESKVFASEQEIALAVQPDLKDDSFSWADDEAITILDHYVRKSEKQMLYKLSNGRSINQEELDELIEKSRVVREQIEMQQQMQMMQQPQQGQQEQNMGMQPGMEQQQPVGAAEPPQSAESATPENPDLMTLFDDDQPVRIEDKRETKRSKIIHYKIAGEFVLDESEFPAEDMPVIFLDQSSYFDKNGKQMCRSFFMDCKDTQRYINYLRTQAAYIIKISRYDQFIGSKKNVAGLDTQRNWKDPTSVQGMLFYDESPSGAKPEQLRPPELPQSLLTQYQLAIEDLYTCTGLYPTRMGQPGNEASGKAINARSRQGSYATQVAMTSVNRAIEAAGVIVNQMIPRVYDAERVIALMLPDEGMRNITINKQADEYGMQVENDIRKGTYQVRLKPGPSFEGQKEEALLSLQQVLQVDPAAFKLVADLYADNLPLVNNLEIKNRLKTMVPPEIIEAGKTGKLPQQGQGPNPEQQQMAMQAQMAQAEIQYKQQQIEIKKQELQLKAQELQLQMQMEMAKLETERMGVAGQIEEQKLRYLAETERTQADTATAHADNLVKILTHKQSM